MSTVDRIALTAMLSVAVVIPMLCSIAFGFDTRFERSARAPALVVSPFKSNHGAAGMAVAAGRD